MEVIARDGDRSPGYGSGYCLGAGLVLTCAHILVPGTSSLEISVRDTTGHELPVSVAWRNLKHDLALLVLSRGGPLPEAVASLGILPSVTSGLRVDFVMWGWPRGGDVQLSPSKTVREAVQVDGEIKLAEFAASKSGLVRLRPAESYPALEKGSYWTGMSGAAVHCNGHVVGVQRQQPDLRLTGYLMARTFDGSALQVRDGDVSGAELLEGAAIPLKALAFEDVAAGLNVPGESGRSVSATTGGGMPRRRVRAVRPYMLLETGRVVGRVELQDQIREFVRDPDGVALLLLVGVAGIGKSALAWSLWKQLRSEPDQAGHSLFWYSFYDGQGAGSFQRLLDELGRFFGVEATGSRIDVDEALLLLAGNPTVLVLDGIERCLRCYQRTLAVGDLDAIQVHEADAVGWEDRDLAFASEEVFRFFLQLVELQGSQVIATSRVVPSDYLASGSALRAGIGVEMVGALSAEEGTALLDAVGLEVEEPLGETISDAFGGHPLALQLFAQRASRSPSAQLDLGAWMQQEGYSLALGRGAAEVRRILFAKAVAELSPAARQALVAVGALGGDLDQASLFEILGSDDFSDRQFEEMTDELAASGLCVVSSARRIASHALTSLAAADDLEVHQLEQLAKRVAERLAGRFQAIDVWGDGYYEWFVNNEISDRVEALTLCRALVGLRRFPEAAEVYLDQLDLPIRFVLGANFEAIELISSMVSGLEEETEEDRVRRLRERLAGHLLMANRIHEAEVLTARLEYLVSDGYQTAAEAALHLGRYDAALRLATTALHEARSELSYALDYDYSGFQTMGDKQVLDAGGPSAHFIEAAVLCARILAFAGRAGEAAMLLAEATDVSRKHHSQCDGCRGLILRLSGEILVSEGAWDFGMEVAAYGKGLQEGQGKELQGLLTEVVVRAKAILTSKSEFEPDREFLDFLSDNGFALYQLILEAAAERRSSLAVDGETAQSRAQRDLASAGASYALKLLGAGGGCESEAVRSVSVAGCVGWLIERTARKTGAERGRERPEKSGDVLRRVDAWLEEAIQAVYPTPALAVLAEELDDRGESSGRGAEDGEILALLPAWERSDADRREGDEDLDGAQASLRRAVALDPCHAPSLARLAEIAADSGDSEAAFDFAKRVLLNASTSFETYRFIAGLVVEQGPFADDVRGLLSHFAFDDHSSPAAYLVLANLELRFGARQAAGEWCERGLDYPATFFGDSHRAALCLGLALAGRGEESRLYSLEVKTEAGLVASYLLDCALSGEVPQRQVFIGGCEDDEVTEGLYEEVRKWMVEESARLEGGECFARFLAGTPA